MAAARKLDKRFYYFDSLKTLAATLTQEATGLLDVTKSFESKLDQTYASLETDYKDSEIDFFLEDPLFMDDFAQGLNDQLTLLATECDKVIADCIARKKRLEDALIWDKVGDVGFDQLHEPIMPPLPDEKKKLLALTELAATGEATLMSHFYNDLAAGCNQWYDHASMKFESDAHDFNKIINNMKVHKNIMMNYGREQFHAAKSNIFNIADLFIDSQRAVGSVYSYFQ